MHRHDVVPFVPAHLAEMGCPPMMVHTARQLHSQHPAWTGRCAGRPVGAAGVVVPHRGFGEAWAVLAADTPATHRVFVYRTIRRRLSGLVEALALHRLQGTVLAGHAAGHQLVMHLGLRPEAVLRGYGPGGEDAWIYSIVRGAREEG